MKIILSVPKDQMGLLADAARDAGLVEVAQSIESSLREASPEVDERYREACRDKHCSEGELECDDDAVVSKGDDTGAYVQCWRWVTDEEAGI